MKFKSAGMLERTDEKVENNKNSDDRFNSFLNLSFSRIFSGLLEEKQPKCVRYSHRLLKELQTHHYVLTLY